jgi:ABC-2 type transport system permease protein
MTASILTGASAPAVQAGRFTGLGPLLRKDTTEWLRGRRAWIVLALTAVFMTLTAANGWISATIAAGLPEGATVGKFSLEPTDNLLAAVGAQIFVLATILAVASLIVGERQTGTLAWVASKPVSRYAIWTSKWVSASAILGITAAVVPLAVTVAVVVALYGVPPVGLVVGLAVGMAATIAFFAAVGLAAGTVMTGQAAITAVGFGVFAVAPVLAGILPFDVTPFLPASILTWTAGFASGADVGWATPIAWLVATGVLVALSLRRMSHIEL